MCGRANVNDVHKDGWENNAVGGLILETASAKTVKDCADKAKDFAHFNVNDIDNQCNHFMYMTGTPDASLPYRCYCCTKKQDHLNVPVAVPVPVAVTVPPTPIGPGNTKAVNWSVYTFNKCRWTDKGAWDSEPEKMPKFSLFVAAVLRSRCQAARPHKIIVLDHATGDVVFSAPWILESTPNQQQFSFFTLDKVAPTTMYSYEAVIASNTTLSTGGSREFSIYKYTI